MNPDVNRDEILQSIHKEAVDWRAWAGRALVMVFAALAGLTVVAFTWMTELTFGAFEQMHAELLVEPIALDTLVHRRHRLGHASLCHGQRRLGHSAGDGRARSAA